MGSTCCKKYESPYSSPRIPDFARLFATYSEQIQCCQKYKPSEDETPPKTRKFSRSDISAPLPYGCTLPAPKRPPRKRKCRLSRSQSLIVEPVVTNVVPLLVRSKSIHDIVYEGSHLVHDEDDFDRSPVVIDSMPVPSFCFPALTSREDLTSRLEPILESDYEETAAAAPSVGAVEESPLNSLNLDLVADNKRHFLATLLTTDESNNQLNSLPSRKSSITESLREFESSLYDMLEQQQESTKDEIEEIKWKPQIPIF